MQAIPTIPDEPRDRSIEQLAAARNYLAALAAVGDAVRLNRLDDGPRDRLRAAFGELGRAGVPADDCANAINAATALLAATLNAPGVVAIAAERTDPPPAPAGPIAGFLALVRPLVALGRVSLQVTLPRPRTMDVVRALELEAPDLIRRDSYGGAALLVVVEADQVDVTLHVPPPPAPPARTLDQLRDDAHARGEVLAGLERRELAARGADRGR